MRYRSREERARLGCLVMVVATLLVMAASTVLVVALLGRPQ